MKILRGYNMSSPCSRSRQSRGELALFSPPSCERNKVRWIRRYVPTPDVASSRERREVRWLGVIPDARWRGVFVEKCIQKSTPPRPTLSLMAWKTMELPCPNTLLKWRTHSRRSHNVSFLCLQTHRNRVTPTQHRKHDSYFCCIQANCRAIV